MYVPGIKFYNCYLCEYQIKINANIEFCDFSESQKLQNLILAKSSEDKVIKLISPSNKHLT